jgi:hypothetical protein
LAHTEQPNVSNRFKKDQWMTYSQFKAYQPPLHNMDFSMFKTMTNVADESLACPSKLPDNFNDESINIDLAADYVAIHITHTLCPEGFLVREETR